MGRSMRSRIEAGASGFILSCALATCGGEDPLPTTPSDGPKDPEAVIRMQDDEATPATLLVEVGKVVEWRNVGTHLHSVLDYGSIVDGVLLPGAVWQVKELRPGESLQHVFERPGEYSYICGNHGEVGGIVVTE